MYQADVMNIGDFPNLPYLIDGDLKFSETEGIARYIVRRGGRPEMLGKNPQDEAVMNNFLYAFEGLITPLLGMTFDKKVNEKKTGHFYKTKGEFNKV